MNRPQNHYAMFELPVSYAVDLQLLNERYLKLQHKFHPDRYSNKPEQEQHLAVQYTADINQAHSVLKSPLSRAQYLLELQGVDSSGDTTVTSDIDFLMLQMQLREALSEIGEAGDPFEALGAISERANEYFNQLQTDFSEQYQQADYDSARDIVAKLQFYSKLLSEIDQREQDLDEL